MKIIRQAGNILCFFIAALYFAAVPAKAISSDIHETVPLEQGVLLVAKPHLSGPSLMHSIEFLVSYGKEGARGVVLNKPAYIQLRHLVPELKGMKGAAIPLFKGGPVSTSDINMLFTSDTPREGALQVFDDVSFTGRKEVILSLLQDKPLNTKVRVYSGHAGWAPGQLEHEIMRGDWITIKADLNKIFSEEPARIWPLIFKIREDMMI